MHPVDPEDREITCEDDGTVFTFTKKEQDFYKEKGLNEPKRCKPCREKRKRDWENRQ